MAEFVVRSIPGSPFGRAVIATLIEKKADFRFEAVAPGQHRNDPHTRYHPFGRVPALSHNDFHLYETQAILRYLDHVRPAPALTPTDAQRCARMDQLIGICDWYLFHGVANVIGFQRIVGPRLMGLTPDENVIADAMPRAHQVFAELSRLLGDNTWLTGNTITLADFHVAPHVEFLAMTPEWQPLTAERQNLARWVDRMRDHPSFAATTWERVAAMAQAA